MVGEVERRAGTWTADEDRAILDAAVTDAQLAAQLGRSRKAITNRRYRLRQQGTAPAQKRCSCGRRHRKPAWVDEAVELYFQKGLSYEATAARLHTPAMRRKYGTEGMRGPDAVTVRYWLQHEGVRARDYREAARKQRARQDPDTVARPALRKRRLCKCGCGSKTSGRAYQRDGRWRYPEYIAGHQPKNLSAGKPRERRAEHSRLTASAWLDRVERERQARGWTLAELEEKSGVAGLSKGRAPGPRHDVVIRIAGVLGIDQTEALHLAGWEEPSPLGWKVLDYQLAGGTLVELAEQSGVGRQVLGQVLLHPERTLSKANLDKLAPLLALTPAEYESALDRRTRQGTAHPAAAPAARAKAVQTIVSSDPHFYEKIGAKGTAAIRATWADAKSRKELRAARAGQWASQRIALDPARLKELRDAGLSFRQIGEALGVSTATAYDRAVEHGIVPGRTRKQREQERRQRERAQRARAARGDESDERRRRAEEDADGLGAFVHLVDVETFARTHGIREGVASDILKSARAKVAPPS